MNATLKNLLRTTHFQVAITFFLLALIVLGFYYGSQLSLGTNVPYVFVSTESMHISNYNSSRSWIHPFEQTLQRGDLLVVQGVASTALKSNYPNSDIIVFYDPDNTGEKIAHRIMAKTELEGKQYFFTKGDGETYYNWPDSVNPAYYDRWLNSNADTLRGAVSEDLVLGKVVLRVPWVGYFPLLIQNVLRDLGWGNVGVIAPLVVLLIIPAVIELGVLWFKHKPVLV